jgi:antitoxin component YwqK of YwqJK toxin-antitoxin module
MYMNGVQHGEAVETFPNGTVVHSFYNMNEKQEQLCYIQNVTPITNGTMTDGLVQKIVDCMG